MRSRRSRLSRTTQFWMNLDHTCPSELYIPPSNGSSIRAAFSPSLIDCLFSWNNHVFSGPQSHTWCRCACSEHTFLLFSPWITLKTANLLRFPFWLCLDVCDHLAWLLWNLRRACPVVPMMVSTSGFENELLHTFWTWHPFWESLSSAPSVLDLFDLWSLPFLTICCCCCC